MRRLQVVALLFACFAPTLSMVRAEEPEERALQELQRRGCRFARDADAMGRPVVMLDLSGFGWGDDAMALIADLKNLRELNLSHCNITDEGLKSLLALKHLQQLNLSSTKVTDAGMKDLAKATSLTHLNLSHAAIGDAGARELAAIPNLTVLALEATQITDHAMKDIARLHHLTELNIYFCTNVTTAGVREIAGLKKLSKLNIGATKITNDVLKPLAGLDLTSLDLSLTGLTDPVLEDVVVFKRLAELRLITRGIGDGAMKHVAQLSELRSLILHDNVGAAGLSELAPLKHLSLIDVRRDTLNDAMLLALNANRQLHLLAIASGEEGARPARGEDVVRLDLAMTGVSDAGMKALASFPNLRFLNIRKTAVTASGLKMLKSFDRLETLYMDDELLTRANFAEFGEADLLHAWSHAKNAVGQRPKSRDDVHTLDLRFCRIDGGTFIRDNIIEALPNLAVLHVRGNQVGESPAATIQKDFPKLAIQRDSKFDRIFEER